MSSRRLGVVGAPSWGLAYSTQEGVLMRMKATVRVVLEVEADSVWGDDTTIAQVVKQASADVIALLTGDNPHLTVKDIQSRVRGVDCVEVRVYKESGR